MKVFKSNMTLAFKDRDLDELYSEAQEVLYKDVNTINLSIILTILLSVLVTYDAFQVISFTSILISYLIMGLFGLLTYSNTKKLQIALFYASLVQLIVLKALFNYMPSTYVSLLECSPLFLNSLAEYNRLLIFTAIILFRTVFNLLITAGFGLGGFGVVLNDALIKAFLILVIYVFTKLSKQAFFYKTKYKKKKEMFENIFNSVNIGLIEVQDKKVKYVNKHVIDILDKITNGHNSFKSCFVKNEEKITEAIFSTFFNSKFEEDSMFDFKDLNNISEQFKHLGNRILTISNIDLIEFEIWVSKIKNEKFIFLLKECSCVKKLQDELKKQQKFKSSFLSKIAHEFKNPLISINELVDQLGHRSTKYSSSNTVGSNINEQPTKAAQSKYILEDIKAYLKYLMLLIKDLSYTSKHEELQLSKCNLNSIISFVQKVTNCLIKKFNKQTSLKFILKVDKEIPRFVTTYEDGLKQILMNLITNAIKNTTSGAITLNIIKQDNNNNLKFQIDDTGMGFKLDAFEDFKQFTNDYKLGLYIIYDLTSKLGGTIQFISEAGKGSSFWFTIPIEHDSPVVTQKKYFTEFSEDEIDNHNLIEFISKEESECSSYDELNNSFDSIYSKETVRVNNLVINYTYDFKPRKTIVYNISDFINYTQPQDEQNQNFIIIVDDEKMTRLSNIRLFSEIADQAGRGLNILEAEDGIECLYYLFLCNKKSIKISAIFSDQTMNYLDGSCILSIVNKLIAKKAINYIPFYIITAYEDEGTLVVLRDSLPKEIYTKPLKRKIAEKIMKDLYK
jgi:signal transduction histidine kinase